MCVAHMFIIADVNKIVVLEHYTDDSLFCLG